MKNNIILKYSIIQFKENDTMIKQQQQKLLLSRSFSVSGACIHPKVSSCWDQ